MKNPQRGEAGFSGKNHKNSIMKTMWAKPIKQKQYVILGTGIRPLYLYAAHPYT